MIAQLGIGFQTWVTGLGVIQIALACVIVALAALGYTRQRSRAMLLLGVGIASLTIVPVLFRYVFQQFLGVQASAIVAMGVETVGLAVILSSIALARQQ